MIFKHIQHIDRDKNFIFPCRKANLKDLPSITASDNLDFDGEFSTYQLVFGEKGNKIYVLGLGEEKDAVKIGEAFRKLCYDTKKYWNGNMQIFAEHLTVDAVKKATIGLEMASYEIGQFKSNQPDEQKLTISIASTKDISNSLEEGKVTGDTINKVKSLVDAPSNHKTPDFLGRWAMDAAKQGEFKCRVLGKDQLIKEGFGAVLAVGQGSANPPVVIVMEYKAKPKAKMDIGLVGKGITFDTGGLSIKSSTNLHYMKSDMGGAAVVLGVMELVVKFLHSM